MIRRLAVTVGAMVVLGALSVTLSLVSPLRRPPAEPVDLLRATQLTCATAGQVLGLGDARLTSRTLDDAHEVTAEAQLETTTPGPSTLSADAILVGGVLTAEPARAWTACTTPSPAGMVLVAEPQNMELVIVNSDAHEAVVDLSLYGADGEIEAVGTRGIAVAPGVSRVVALSILAPEGPVGVAYSASTGRAAVIARPVEGRTAATAVSSVPLLEQVIAGIPADAATTRLLLSNPTENRVPVTVTALGASASYEPAPAAGVSLPPMSTLAVDLGAALGGEASALSVTAEAPVAAAVVVEVGAGVVSHLVPGSPALELGALVPQAQSVQLTNPGTGEATVDLTVGEDLSQVVLAPGSSTLVPVELTATAPVRLSSDVAVLASVNSGGSVIGLGATVEDESTAGVVGLDPGLR